MNLLVYSKYLLNITDSPTTHPLVTSNYPACSNHMHNLKMCQYVGEDYSRQAKTWPEIFKCISQNQLNVPYHSLDYGNAILVGKQLPT